MGRRMLGTHVDGHEPRLCHIKPQEQRVCRNPDPRVENLFSTGGRRSRPIGEFFSGLDGSQRESRRGHTPPVPASWLLSRRIPHSKPTRLLPLLFSTSPGGSSSSM